MSEIPYGFCHCGCGEKTRISTRNHTKHGFRKGEPIRYVKGHNGRKHPPAPDGSKTCARCGETKPEGDFHLVRRRSQNVREGTLKSNCKLCDAELVQHARAADPEHARVLSRLSYARHRDARRAAARARQATDDWRAYFRAYRQANPDYVVRVRESQRRWWERLPEEERRRLTRRQNAVRKARMKAALVLEPVEHGVVWERDGGICGICGAPADPTDWHLDHIVPLARGGDHSYANTHVSHPRCNLQKGARAA